MSAGGWQDKTKRYAPSIGASKAAQTEKFYMPTLKDFDAIDVN
jgi:hypothetical protein